MSLYVFQARKLDEKAFSMIALVLLVWWSGLHSLLGIKQYMSYRSEILAGR
jgi:hypothetical protein